jgi:hypothetical protein
MTDFALDQNINGTDSGPIEPASRPNLDKGFNPLTIIIFFGILAAGLGFVAYSTRFRRGPFLHSSMKGFCTLTQQACSRPA